MGLRARRGGYQILPTARPLVAARRVATAGGVLLPGGLLLRRSLLEPQLPLEVDSDGRHLDLRIPPPP
eukprot:262813-Prymnesium_polylepis.1